MKIHFLKNDQVKLISFAIFIFSFYTLFLIYSGYFEIGLLSDDYLNFISAENSTLKQKLASSIPYYSSLHFRPIWFLSINFSIWLNNIFEFTKGNFTLYRIENLIYFYLLIFLASYLLLKISKRLILSITFIFLCLLYPNNINNICWTVGKVDLLCGIFIFSSLLLTFSYLDKKNLYKIFLSLLFFILALFTKETSIILPFITIALVYISYNIEKVVEIKYLLALEFMLLMIYSLTRFYVIGIYPSEIVTTFQTPGLFSILGVTFRAVIALIIPYDYLSIQDNMSIFNFPFFLYLFLIVTFLVTTIFVLIRTENFKYIFYLGAIFLISITPNLIAGYFRPQLILIPYLIFYLALLIIMSRIKFDLKFFKIILPVLFIFWIVLSFNLITDWKYAYQNTAASLKNLIELKLDTNKKNIFLCLPSRLRQSFMIDYAIGPYNYWKYGEFKIHDKIYDLIHTGALDTNSMNLELYIKQIGDKEYEIETNGDTQYLFKLTGNTRKHIDEDIIIKLSEKNLFRKMTKMYVKILSDRVNVYVYSGNKFMQIN